MVPRRGHEIIIESKKFIEARGYEVIYGDTDSVFVLLGAVAGDDVAVIGSTLAAQLNRWWRDKLQKEYDIDSYLEIEFEIHFSKFLMPTVRDSVKQTVSELLDGKFESELALRKTLRRKLSDYVKNVPPHV